MSSGPSHILILSQAEDSANVVPAWREFIGPADTEDAKRAKPERLVTTPHKRLEKNPACLSDQGFKKTTFSISPCTVTQSEKTKQQILTSRSDTPRNSARAPAVQPSALLSFSLLWLPSAYGHNTAQRPCPTLCTAVRTWSRPAGSSPSFFPTSGWPLKLSRKGRKSMLRGRWPSSGLTLPGRAEVESVPNTKAQLHMCFLIPRFSQLITGRQNCHHAVLPVIT